MQLPAEPSVLVLLVATDGTRWLPEVLRGLRAQRHRPIDIVAVDNGSADGSREMLVRALGVRRIVTLERRVGYGRALAAGMKLAAERGSSPDVFLLLHDDAVLAPGAIDSMIDAMRADGVGIVGAKLLEWDDPNLLQDIGQTADRYGRRVPRVERGERDQGQHDGVHDVLYATSAALLIARPVVEKVGLFDLRYVVLRDDFDFCWRARLAGIRTVVTTAAAARHASATVRGVRSAEIGRRVRYFADRNMIATLAKNYSRAHLALALPMTVVISLVNAVLFLVTGRRASAGQSIEAVQWNLAHLPSTLRARRRAQALRAVPDREVTALMHHGATRLRAQIEHALEIVAGDVPEAGEGDLEALPPRVRDRVRAHPVLFLGVFAAAVIFAGARTLLYSGAIAGTDLAPFPHSPRGFFTEFASGWRGAGLGGAAPATPGLVLLGILTMLCLGSAWVAQRVLLFGLPAVGVLTMFRCARAMGLGPWSRRAAVVLYASSPLLLGAFGVGRITDLVVLAAAPGVVLAFARAAGLVTAAGWKGRAASVAGVAVATALSPWTLVFAAGTAAVFVAVAPSRRRSVASLAASTVGGSLILLFPWSVELFRPGSPLGAGGSDPASKMLDLLGLSAGPAHPLPLFLVFGLPAAALLGFAWASRERRPLVGALGALAFCGVAAAWAVARGVPWIAPRSSLPLVAAAVAASLVAAVSLESVSSLAHREFGMRHVLAGAAGALVLSQLVASAGWIAAGVHPGLHEAGGLLPSFVTAESEGGRFFRIAWVSGSAAAPRAALTGPEGSTMRTFLDRRAGAGADAFRRAVAAIAGGATDSGGRLLATFGVRYVIVRPGTDSVLADAVARQVDLAFTQRFHGATVYRDTVGLPPASGIQAPGWVIASARDLDAAAGAEFTAGASSPFRRTSESTYEGTLPPTAREVLLAEDYSRHWRLTVRASSGVTPAPPGRSFGWATRFLVPRGARSVRIDWTGQRMHVLALLIEIAVVLGFAGWWSQRAARERGER